MLDRRTLPLSALRAFESAATHLHLGRAGIELGVTHGAISHQVRALEDRLGVKLFARERNKLALTPAGARLHGAVKDGLERILEGTRNLNPDDLTGPLVIGCTHTIGSSWAAKHLCEFRTKYPTVQIIVKEIQPRQKNIPREIDIAICYGEPESNGRQIKMLASPSLFPVCSPALIQGRTGRVNPKEISSFTLLHDNQVSWDRWFETHNIVKPEVQESIIFPNTSQALTSARLGYGVALGNTFEIQEFVREGQLIQLTDESIEEEQSYFLVSRNEDQMSLKSKIFEEWIVKECLSI